MSASHRPPIRFGIQVDPTAENIDTIGPEAEASGFDVISVADHVGASYGSPLVNLARIAGTTSTIKLGTMVINNDMRNPVQLAWESLTLNRLSGGRFELGLGAGHTPHEYEETGITLDRPAVRKRRLAEAVEIIASLFAGGTVDFGGEFYNLSGATVTEEPALIPILVGGNGTALLTHAATHADAIGLQGLGRTLADGHRHTVKFGVEHLEAQLATIAGASDRAPELGALLQVCEITDDREEALSAIVGRVEDLTDEDATSTPYLAVGTVDELAEQLIRTRDRWGISYFTTRKLEMTPVVARVRELEAHASKT